MGLLDIVAKPKANAAEALAKLKALPPQRRTVYAQPGRKVVLNHAIDIADKMLAKFEKLKKAKQSEADLIVIDRTIGLLTSARKELRAEFNATSESFPKERDALRHNRFMADLERQIRHEAGRSYRAVDSFIDGRDADLRQAQRYALQAVATPRRLEDDAWSRVR